MRRVGFGAALAACLWSACVAVCAADEQATATAAARQSRDFKVVFQVSDADPQKWNLALNNVHNVQTELGEENVDVEIVTYGPGIGMLKKGSEVAGRVQAAREHGVTIVACETTMRSLKLVYDDMLPQIGFVPAGVVELMKKQKQGYAYIRP